MPGLVTHNLGNIWESWLIFFWPMWRYSKVISVIGVEESNCDSSETPYSLTRAWHKQVHILATKIRLNLLSHSLELSCSLQVVLWRHLLWKKQLIIEYDGVALSVECFECLLVQWSPSSSLSYSLIVFYFHHFLWVLLLLFIFSTPISGKRVRPVVSKSAIESCTRK